MRPSPKRLLAPRPRTLAMLLLTSSLGACSMFGLGHKAGATPDDAPTLKTLLTREVVIDSDPGIPADEDKAIAAYRNFLAVTPDARQRAEALRRLGDLSMASADNANAVTPTPNGTPDYAAAIAQYRDYLKTYPNDPDNDRILYQLARAQEQGGQLEDGLKTLDQLVAQYPKTRYLDEAEFRRGELLFTLRQYPKAEQAYTLVLNGQKDNPYVGRALYMQGWSKFKQGNLEEALTSFFGVLDGKIVGINDDDLDKSESLTRADKELVDDTLRVIGISLANLKGAESIPAYVTTDARRSYEFRVYQQLGQLYLRQERPKDAADTYAGFARLNPLDAQAPAMQAQVIAIDQEAGFDQLALAAKKDYVAQYGLDGEFRKANPDGWEHAQPLVKTALAELAQRYHASAQKTKSRDDYVEAAKWYRAWLAEFGSDPEAAENDFLLAEVLYESGQFGASAVEYEKTAYEYPTHAHGADAGYSALLAHAAEQKGVTGDALVPLQRTGVESSLRFAAAYPADSRTPAVLANAADTLFKLHDNDRAASVAEQVLALEPAATPAQRRVAWTLIAHTSFEAGSFDRAEKGYGEVLALAPANDPARGELTERLAASIYKQGEQARTAGDNKAAAERFARVAVAAPGSAIRANAEYDTATSLIALKDWAGAAHTLEDFRQRFPGNALQGDVTVNLALAYSEQQQWAPAAAQYERIAAAPATTPEGATRARAALWQAATLYERAASSDADSVKAGKPRPADAAANRALAAKAYDRYLKQYPSPLEPAVEARWRIAQIAHIEGNAAVETAQMHALFLADQNGGAARTDRTRTLGAMAALDAAQPVFEAYQKVPLIEPLAKQLKLKKAKMEDALKAYALASDYGVAEVTTAATFHVATVYQDFAKALVGSQRPRKLSKLELEQYNELLEEQADPYVEKAIALHGVNAHRTTDGLYDEWVKKSFEALKTLQPARYNKTERSEGSVDAIR
ncbi:MAG: tetratricopeptide repeat protein [Caulobacter sp.]|nr:tetratricopeptide repeat protein [Vitreoscilla sp.]